MLPLRHLGEAAFVPVADHFDGRNVRHERSPGVLVRKALLPAVLHDDALGRRHAATNFREKRERREGTMKLPPSCASSGRTTRPW